MALGVRALLKEEPPTWCIPLTLPHRSSGPSVLQHGEVDEVEGRHAGYPEGDEVEMSIASVTVASRGKGWRCSGNPVITSLVPGDHCTLIVAFRSNMIMILIMERYSAMPKMYFSS